MDVRVRFPSSVQILPFFVFPVFAVVNLLYKASIFQGDKPVTTLRRINLEGFKSIKKMDIELHNLNVLIGANGAGKSNIISFFKMLNEMMGGRLQEYIGASGRAQSLLHFGPKITPQITAQLEFAADKGIDTYIMRLFHAPGDTLFFAEETVGFQRTGQPSPQKITYGTGHQESQIGEFTEKNQDTISKTLRFFLNRCRVFHFHDTSSTARIRQFCYINFSHLLMPDAGNLAALLYRFRNENNSSYKQIVSTIRLIAPFFNNFDLEPSGPGNTEVILNWREKGSDQVFGPHQLSDGTLRAICLVTLLLQPENELPGLIIVDEPELGLHPYALNIIAALFKKASHHTQILISTQSTTFLNNFDTEDVIVVSRNGHGSQFERLDPAILQAWLEEYSLGEVWEKNIIGGGPH
jgi:predicted ATPase